MIKDRRPAFYIKILLNVLFPAKWQGTHFLKTSLKLVEPVVLRGFFSGSIDVFKRNRDFRESSANHSIGTSSSSTSYAKADSALRNQEKPSIFDYDSEEDNALFIESVC